MAFLSALSPYLWLLLLAISASIALILGLAARRGRTFVLLVAGLLLAVMGLVVSRVGAFIALQSVHCGIRCGHGATVPLVAIAAVILFNTVVAMRPDRRVVFTLAATVVGAVALGLTLDVWQA